MTSFSGAWASWAPWTPATPAAAKRARAVRKEMIFMIETPEDVNFRFSGG